MCDYSLFTISGSMITIKLQDLFFKGRGALLWGLTAEGLSDRIGHISEALMVDYLYPTPAEARDKAFSLEGREGA